MWPGFSIFDPLPPETIPAPAASATVLVRRKENGVVWHIWAPEVAHGLALCGAKVEFPRKVIDGEGSSETVLATHCPDEDKAGTWLCPYCLELEDGPKTERSK